MRGTFPAPGLYAPARNTHQALGTYCGLQQALELVHVDRVRVEFPPPPCAAIGIEWNSHYGDIKLQTHPHSSDKLRYARNTEDTDAATLLLRFSKQPPKICTHPDIRFDSAKPQHFAGAIDVAPVGAPLANVVDVPLSRATIRGEVSQAVG